MHRLQRAGIWAKMKTAMLLQLYGVFKCRFALNFRYCRLKAVKFSMLILHFLTVQQQGKTTWT